MKFYTRFNPPPPVNSPSGDVDMTEQQYKDECDINTILRNYGAVPVPIAEKIPRFADVSEVGDFAKSLSMVTRATEAFEAQPSSLRARFGHDPSAFYEFVSNPDNRAECIKLGLIEEPDNSLNPVDLLQKIADGVTAPAATPSSAE